MPEPLMINLDLGNRISPMMHGPAAVIGNRQHGRRLAQVDPVERIEFSVNHPQSSSYVYCCMGTLQGETFGGLSLSLCRPIELFSRL